MRWEIKNILARDKRPGYPKDMNISDSEIKRWIENAKNEGIKSIICLLDDKQLKYYDIADGLIAYYRNNGMVVAHIPIADYQTPPIAEHALRNILREFKKLPKPVLIHCSAGIDRTGAAIAFIRENLDNSCT